MAINELEDAFIFFEDWGVTANITRASAPDLPGITVLVDKDVEVVSDNGLAITKRTVITFQAAQLVSSGERVLLDEGDQVVVSGETYSLLYPFSDDGAVVLWYAR